MSSIAEPFQRDELHLFMAVLLHLIAGLVIYLLMVTGERQPHSVMLEGLPIVFGKMISPGELGGDAPKSLAKATPAEAQQAKSGEADQAVKAVAEQRKPDAASKAEPVQRQVAGTVAAKTPEAPAARTADPVTVQNQARPPAAVALNSPPGTPPAAANVPTLRLQPDPKQAEREPPPVEAQSAQKRTAPHPAAEKAAEDAKAKLANVPGVKPAIVPQIDSRQRVVVPPKPLQRKPEPVEEQEVKTAEARRANQAESASVGATDPKAADAKQLLPPVETKTGEPANAAKPLPQTGALERPDSAREAAAAQPPAAEQAVTAEQTITARPRTVEHAAAAEQAAVIAVPPKDSVKPQTAPAAATTRQTAEPPAAQAARPSAEAPTVQQRVAGTTPEPPATAASATPVPEQRASQPATTAQARTPDQAEAQAREASPGGEEAGTAGGGVPVPRQPAPEPERTETAEAGGAGAGTGRQQGGLSGLKKFGKLSGLGAGKTGTPGGKSASGGSALEKEGTALGMACLRQNGVFKAGDDILATVDVKIDPGTKYLQLAQTSGTSLSRPRMTELERALNGCGPFKDILFAQRGLTKFRFTFGSSRR